jgi:hypothetical protein
MPMSEFSPFQRHRRSISMIIMLVCICLGVYTKFYTGPAAEWVNNSLGGVFYVIFWCQLIHVIWPDSSPVLVSIAVLVITCAIEFTQLSHIAILELIRKTFPGRALIGNSFNTSDFGYYIAGAIIAWSIQYCIIKRIKLDKHKKNSSKQV